MQISVSTTEIKVLSRNSNRRYLMLINEHTDTIRISFGNRPASTGVPLSASLGYWEIPSTTFLAIPPDSEFFQNVQAVAASGTGNLTVIEG